MPPSTHLLAFLAVSLVLIAIPGPSVLFVVSRAVAIGRGAAVRTALGNALGASVLVVGISLGLGAVLSVASVTSVSYTHLDVYKRQGLDNGAHRPASIFWSS